MKTARGKGRAPARQLQIYDGQSLLGSISIDGGAFIAFDAKGRRLGSFGNQAAASAAIDAAASSNAST
jgi:hypothetical protein